MLSIYITVGTQISGKIFINLSTTLLLITYTNKFLGVAYPLNLESSKYSEILK